MNQLFAKLSQDDFMRKEQVKVATYKVNSRVLVKGTDNKRVGFMLKYGL